MADTKKRHIFSCLLRNERGATAVEFALIMPFFAMLLFAMLEVSLMFFAGSIMEGAVDDAARMVRTGQAQQSADPFTAFKDQLCGAAYTLIDCSRLSMDVQSFKDFESADLSYNTDGNGLLSNARYDPGAARDIVVIRVAYRWDFTTPLVGSMFSNSGTNGRLMLATAIFRNEPYTP